MVQTIRISPLALPLPELGVVRGVRLAAGAAGIRYTGRTDLVLMEFTSGTTVAGVFTRNKCPGAPVDWCRSVLRGGIARALVVNAGNANVFTGRAGHEACLRTAEGAAGLIGCRLEEVFLASTGVIGEILPVERMTDTLPSLFNALKATNWAEAAHGIMTTDTFPKAAVGRARIGGEEVIIQGIAKGSGMIAPDMATMLSFIATDARLPASVLQALLSEGVKTTFNCITVDSDTSTSDMVLLFSTGFATHLPITENVDALTDPNLADFRKTLNAVLHDLALMVVRDGEGITKLMHITVTGAISDDSARRVGMAIGNSPLVKTAIAGEDANWGRIAMAVGKSGEPADRDKLSISVGGICIANNGSVCDGYDETYVVAHMRGQEVDIAVDLGQGNGSAKIWSSDLTHGYVDINGSYRS